LQSKEAAMPSKTFSMRMDAELRAALDAQAKLEERSASQIAERAIKEWLDRREAVRKELQTALIEADAGVWISSEAVDRWMERWAEGIEEPFPEPDVFPDGHVSGEAA
jgi:predicted transcriptional regulator